MARETSQIRVLNIDRRALRIAASKLDVPMLMVISRLVRGDNKTAIETAKARAELARTKGEKK